MIKNKKYKEFFFSICRNINVFFTNHPLLSCISFSAIIILIIESLCRHSLIGGLIYLFEKPFSFLYNLLIMSGMLSLSLLSKRRYFFLAFISAVWIGLAIANSFVLSYRITPIGAIDILLMDSVLGIIDIYLNVWQMILIVIGILATLAGCAFLWKKCHRFHINYKKTITALIAFIGSAVLCTTIATAGEILPDKFENLAEDYSDYGFVYCFSRSVVDRGVDKPIEYEKEAIDSIVSSLPEDSTDNDKRPNIIFLQLESYFDTNYLKNVIYSENPVPNLTLLKEKYTHGFLSVPSLGAGTANTEFEVLTGMNISHYGAGEYPYKTILADSTCETIAYDLKTLGYNTHALHNHSGTFYDRHEVYARLGFDTFTPVEYMHNVERNVNGWAKDKVLTEEIFTVLESTDGYDFVFAVSVQAHGKYPREVIDETQQITLEGIPDEELDIAYEYFVNQIYETDIFVGELIKAIEAHDEDIVLVLYGDHLPGFNFREEHFTDGDAFTTEYVIYTNFGAEYGVGKDISANYLYPYIFDLIGYNIGVIPKFHNTYYDSDNYDKLLQMLEYDTLYGEIHTYNGVNPFIETNLKMGVRDIKITDITVEDEYVTVIGKNFTESSVVYLNGHSRNTIFIDGNTLKFDADDLKEENTISVAQVGTDMIELSYTENFIYFHDTVNDDE